MKLYITLLLRIALGIGFLSAVADRFGLWGAPGETAVAWGNWQNFIRYTSTLNFGITGGIANALGIFATIAELVFGLLLIIGFKIKYVAAFSGILLLSFAVAMSLNTHIKYVLDYSVFVASFGAFLLAAQPESKWSIDSIINKVTLREN
jgi:putative oxidoreductase